MFLLGIVTGLNYFLGLAGLLIPLAFILKNRSDLYKKLLLFCLLSVIFFFSGLFFSKTYDYKYENAKAFFDGKEYEEIQGEIYKKEYKNDSYRLYVKDILNGGYTDSCFRAIIFCDRNEGEIGSVILASGKIMPVNPPENDGEFDYENYLKSKQISFRMAADEIVVKKSPQFGLRNHIYEYKESIGRFFGDYLPGEESGLLSSIILGDKTDLDADAGELFSKAGLSHILAVSGLHLSVVGAGIYKVLRFFGLSFGCSGIISATVVLFYGMFCGNPISLVRALVMFLVSILANITGRAYDMMTALSLATIILLAANPFVVLDSGFIMSFGAILGIGIFANPISQKYYHFCKERFQRRKKTEDTEDFKLSFREKIVQTVIFSLALQLFTYPIVVYFFSRIPVFVIILNLLVLPVLGVLLFVGLVCGLTFFSPGMVICHYILFYYEMLAGFATNLPFSTIIIAKPGIFAVIFYYVLLSGFLIILLKVDERFTGFLLGICTLILVSFLMMQKPHGFRIDMLSVGQGDGIFIQSKENVSFFIDGGSSSKNEVGKYIIEPYLKSQGVGTVDYWFLTHFDDDHINGFLEIMEDGYRVKSLCVPAVLRNDEKMNDIRRLCNANGTNINYIGKGDKIRTKSLKISVLYPDANLEFSDSNDASLCFILEYGDFQAVFTGDMGKPQEEEILKYYTFPEDIEVLKVAHHGSKNSSCEAWVTAISPEIAIISAGKNNRYGHPAGEVTNLFDKLGIKWYCTKDVGRIRVKSEGVSLLSNIFSFILLI